MSDCPGPAGMSAKMPAANKTAKMPANMSLKKQNRLQKQARLSKKAIRLARIEAGDITPVIHGDFFRCIVKKCRAPNVEVNTVLKLRWV